MGMFTGSHTEPILIEKQPALIPVTGRPALSVYIRSLWSRRYFIKAQARARAFSGTRNMLLGNAWLLLEPLLNAAVYGLIFGVMLKTSRGVEHFIPFLIVGVIFFSTIIKALNGGAGLIQANKNMIRGFSFPRATIPLSRSLHFFYDSIPIIAVCLIVIVFFPQGRPPTLTWVFFPAIWLLQAIFNTGLIFFSSWITYFVPDMRTLLSYVSRLWFYCSGVFFSVDHFVHNPTLLQILKSNPGFILLDMFRSVLIFDTIPPLSQWITMTIWAFSLFAINFLIFWRFEVSYGRSN